MQAIEAATHCLQKQQITTPMNWFEQHSSSGEGDAADAVMASSDALTVAATPRHFVIGVDNADVTKTQLCATIAARDLLTNTSEGHVRAPVDILVALDASASMRQGKLDLCKVSLELMIRSLRNGDRFGLVSFSDTAEVEIPIQELSEEQKETAIELIKSLEPRRNTNISGAVCLAAEQLREMEKPNPVRAIFLLTDGRANRGRTKCFDLVNLTRACCEDESHVTETRNPSTRPPPITIHCFGYGSNHNSKMLQDISLATLGGSYYFVEKDSDVITAFGDALGGIFSVVAQDVVLTIKVPQESRQLGVNIVKVHHENAIGHKDHSYTVSIGDFYAEESRDVLFEVTLANPIITDVDYWITHAVVSVSFLDAISGKFALCKDTPCDIARVAGTPISKANSHVKVQWLRVRVTETIHEADMLAAKGNVREARVMIENMLESIYMLADDVRLDPLAKQLAQDLDRCKDGLMSYDMYANYGTHTMRNTKQSHGTQRCMDSLGGNRHNVYRGTTKTRTIFNFHQHHC